MVVVLPDPLTPTTISTSGGPPLDTSAPCREPTISAIRVLRKVRTASPSCSPRSSPRISSSSLVVVRTPTSAVIRTSSSLPSSSSSSRAPPANRSSIRWTSCPRVRDRPPTRRANTPSASSGASPVAGRPAGVAGGGSARRRRRTTSATTTTTTSNPTPAPTPITPGWVQSIAGSGSGCSPRAASPSAPAGPAVGRSALAGSVTPSPGIALLAPSICFIEPRVRVVRPRPRLPA